MNQTEEYHNDLKKKKKNGTKCDHEMRCTTTEILTALQRSLGVTRIKISAKHWGCKSLQSVSLATENWNYNWSYYCCISLATRSPLLMHANRHLWIANGALSSKNNIFQSRRENLLYFQCKLVKIKSLKYKGPGCSLIERLEWVCKVYNCLFSHLDLITWFGAKNTFLFDYKVRRDTKPGWFGSS